MIPFARSSASSPLSHTHIHTHPHARKTQSEKRRKIASKTCLHKGRSKYSTYPLRDAKTQNTHPPSAFRAPGLPPKNPQLSPYLCSCCYSVGNRRLNKRLCCDLGTGKKPPQTKNKEDRRSPLCSPSPPSPSFLCGKEKRNRKTAKSQHFQWV